MLPGLRHCRSQGTTCYETFAKRPFLPDSSLRRGYGGQVCACSVGPEDRTGVECLPNGIPPCGPPSEDSTGRAYSFGSDSNFNPAISGINPRNTQGLSDYIRLSNFWQFGGYHTNLSFLQTKNNIFIKSHPWRKRLIFVSP